MLGIDRILAYTPSSTRSPWPAVSIHTPTQVPQQCANQLTRSIDPALGLPALVFIAGAIVMLLFVILSGTTNTTPLNKTYFLQANTLGITGAKAISQWTYFYICGPDNQDCTKASPAMPFGHAWADDADNIPNGIGG